MIKAKLVPNESAQSRASHAGATGRRQARQAHRLQLEDGLSGQTKSLAPTIVLGHPRRGSSASCGGGRSAAGGTRSTWLSGVIPFLDRAVPVLRVPRAGAPRGLLTTVAIDAADVDAAAARIAPFVRPHAGAALALRSTSGSARRCSSRPSTASAWARSSTGARRTRCSRCPTTTRARGVAAHSSGNHAAALALRGARHAGIPAYVVMPQTRRRVEARRGRAVRRPRSRGATTRSTPAVPRSPRCSRATGAIEIHPFDDERVIAGAGTAALELLEEVPDLDVIVTPIGGGGLCSGTCIAAAPTACHRRPPGRPRRDDRRRPAHRHVAAHRARSSRAHGVELIAVDEADDRRRDGRGVGAYCQELHRAERRGRVRRRPRRRRICAGARVGIICSGGNVSSLAALELGVALLRERGHALVQVVARERGGFEVGDLRRARRRRATAPRRRG